jgi:hypothetical protein
MAEIDSRKAALIAEMEVSRGELRGALRRCESNLNPAEALRRSIRNSSGAWLSAAALLGLALSQVVRLRFSRPPGARPEDWQGRGAALGIGSAPRGGGWMLSLGRVAFDLLKPTFADWAAEWLSNFARTKAFTGEPHERNGVRGGMRKPVANRGQSGSQDS